MTNGDVARNILDIWNTGKSPLTESDGSMLFFRIKHALDSQSKTIEDLREQLKGTTHCYDQEEHDKLRKLLSEAVDAMDSCDVRIMDDVKRSIKAMESK